MSEEPIPLARPDLGEREEELVQEVIRSGRLSLGPMLDRFERGLADWLGADDAVGVSSGTAALHLGVRALGWRHGDAVITSPLSFVASANCLLYEGVQPVFCDIDPGTLNIDPQAAEAAIGHRTAGILPVHIFGYPADMAALSKLADSRALAILEDACQALGAVDSEGRRVGGMGEAAAFAFYANKQITTGEGGALIPPTDEVAARVRSERNQGRDSDMSVLKHERLGFNYRLSEVEAAIGIAQLERLDELLEARARVADAYRARLADVEGLELPIADHGQERRSWFVFVVQLPNEVDRDGVIAELAEQGIAAKAYLPCIHTQPLYRARFGYRGGEFPVAERVAARSLALPFFAAMTEEQVERVSDAVRSALGPP